MPKHALEQLPQRNDSIIDTLEVSLSFVVQGDGFMSWPFCGAECWNGVMGREKKISKWDDEWATITFNVAQPKDRKTILAIVVVSNFCGI